MTNESSANAIIGNTLRIIASGEYHPGAELTQKMASYIIELEQKLTDMAVQLANAESKCRELAAENAGLKAVESNLVRNIINDLGDTEFQYEKVQTPASDAFLAEVLASPIPDEATERDLFEEWVMEKIFISKTTIEGLRTDDGYRNSTLSGTDYNGMWSQWKASRAAQLRQEAAK